MRRRSLQVVLALTVLFLALYALGAGFAFHHAKPFGEPIPLDTRAVVGSSLLGMAIFVTLFLAVVLAVFLTHGIVRGDAERGLLQPLVVRPIGRGTFLLARLGVATLVCAAYVTAVYLAAILITDVAGGFRPEHWWAPIPALIAAVAVIAALSTLGSTLFSATANGIAAFMLFGAGLGAGLLGEIGRALASNTLDDLARFASWALPFEALYRDALRELTLGVPGIAGEIVRLGPFGGGSGAGPGLWVWSATYVGLAVALALARFRRIDL